MRKVKAWFVMGLLFVTLVGCGKESVQEEKTTKKAVLENEKESRGDDYEVGNGTSKQSAKETFKCFDADKGWKELTGYEYAVQVDDVLYIPGITAEEILDKVESSSIEYTYEYNGKRLVSQFEDVEIEIYRDEIHWFSVIVCNFEEEVKSLSESLVFKIIPSENALSFSRFIDGRSYTEILQMSYADVQKLAEEKFSGKIKEKEDKDEGENILLVIDAALAVKVDIAHTLSDTSRAYEFVIDKDSGTVSRFYQGEAIDMVVRTYGLSYTPPARQPIKSFSDMTEEEIELLNTIAMKLFENYGLRNIVDSMSYLGKGEQDSEYASYVVIIKNEGRKNVAICRFTGLGREYDGELSYNSYNISYPAFDTYYEKYVEELSPEYILEMRVESEDE